MSSIALVLFAKNPYLSPVKTRLEKKHLKSLHSIFIKSLLEQQFNFYKILNLELLTLLFILPLQKKVD